jgi:microcystin degradation protein MlrC/sugar lactone lactonase YvrE
MRELRVALMGIVHESNTFVAEKTGLGHFRTGHWHFGDDVTLHYRDAFHEVGGMIEAMEEAGIRLLPVMYAEATPGGTVAAEAFEALCASMFEALAPLLPVDGCLVVPHGAGVSESFPDMDGEWLSRLRALVGPGVPIIGTLDPHANVSDRMVAATDALVAYRTNPHVDQRRVGLEAGRILAATLMGLARPLQRHLRLPFAISIEQQRTDREPCLGLLEALSTSAGPGILSASLILGFPYADVAEMGSSLIVVSDDDRDAAQDLLQSVAALATSRLAAFDGERKGISDWIGGLPHVPGPVLMLDMGDNVGGGSPGDSTHLLDHLDDAGVSGAFICLHDPAAVAAAAVSSSDGYFPLRFGRDPVTGHVRVRMVRKIFSGDGAFTEDKPRHGGQMRFDMGAIAIVGTEQGQTVMLTTLRTAPFSLRQLTAFGLDPARFSCIVAKGVNAPIAAYRDVCPTIWQVDTPGVTQADMTRFDFRHRRKPLFPFEVPMTVAATVVAERGLVRLASLDHYTEGPALDASGHIYFTTLTGGGIMRLTPEGLLSEWARTDCPNGQIILPDGDHLVCDSRSGRVKRISPDGRVISDASSEAYHAGHSVVPNDLVMGPNGYLYFTDSVRHDGCICCVGPDGRQWRLAEGLDYPNGIALSADGAWLYVAESYRNRILRFRLRSPGVVDGGYEVFADLPSNPSGDPVGNLPDGIAFNTAGQLAVAHYGMQRVQLLSPEGRLLGSYDSGMPCTSNVFFTDDHTLLVTGGYGEPGPGAVFLMRLPGG